MHGWYAWRRLIVCGYFLLGFKVEINLSIGPEGLWLQNWQTERIKALRSLELVSVLAQHPLLTKSLTLFSTFRSRIGWVKSSDSRLADFFHTHLVVGKCFVRNFGSIIRLRCHVSFRLHLLCLWLHLGISTSMRWVASSSDRRSQLKRKGAFRHYQQKGGKGLIAYQMHMWSSPSRWNQVVFPLNRCWHLQSFPWL